MEPQHRWSRQKPAEKPPRRRLPFLPGERASFFGVGGDFKGCPALLGGSRLVHDPLGMHATEHAQRAAGGGGGSSLHSARAKRGETEGKLQPDSNFCKGTIQAGGGGGGTLCMLRGTALCNPRLSLSPSFFFLLQFPDSWLQRAGRPVGAAKCSSASRGRRPVAAVLVATETREVPRSPSFRDQNQRVGQAKTLPAAY